MADISDHLGLILARLAPGYELSVQDPQFSSAQVPGNGAVLWVDE
jgi:hypothetical protein